MRVALHPDIDPAHLLIRKGNEVVLNESLNVVLVRDRASSPAGSSP